MTFRRASIVRHVDRAAAQARRTVPRALDDEPRGEQPLESCEVAVARGGRKGFDELPPIDDRDPATTSAAEASARSCHELAGVLLAHPDDLRDIAIRVVERFSEHEGGTLRGRQPLQEDGRCQLGSFPLNDAWSAGSTSGGTGSGSGRSSVPTVSRRARAHWEAFSASRAVAVVRNAVASRTLLRSARCQRIHVSCTTSSASATLPSIRYAIPKRRRRTAANDASSARDTTHTRSTHARHAVGDISTPRRERAGRAGRAAPEPRR